MPDLKIFCVVGTRPEAIKMAPVIKALQASPNLSARVCSTGQHQEILDQMLAFFGIETDVELRIMTPGQTLNAIASRAVEKVAEALERERPDWVIVQGDTTTAMAAALAAFYLRIPVAHVEAGLRTADKTIPYPEEMNRRIISQIVDLHFAPTEAAGEVLVAEGHAPDSILVTGNTVIDALQETRARLHRGEIEPPAWLSSEAGRRELVLLTMHRRENFDGGVTRVCEAIAEFAEANPSHLVVFPIHPNPVVREPVRARLSNMQGVKLMDPLGYADLVALLDAAQLVITDSGGIQEEASALGKPIIILRGETERPEVVRNGNGVLVGTDRVKIVKHMTRLAHQDSARRAMMRPCTAYGTGKAAQLIADTFAKHRAEPA